MKLAQIVLIEDNSADVFLVELALKENHVPSEITRFSTGHEALHCLCSAAAMEGQPLHPDAILLDLNTPQSDGFEVLSRLRQTPYLARVPIAILTSSDAASDKHRSALLGASRYIRKPSGLEEFLATVGQAVKEMLRRDPASGPITKTVAG